MVRAVVVAVSCIVTAERTAVADTSPCRSGPRFVILSDGEYPVLHRQGTPREKDEPILEHWRDDIDGDGREDVALSFPATRGTAPESWWGVYASCGGGQYVAVWGPAYITEIEIRSVDAVGGSWKDLVAIRVVEHRDRKPRFVTQRRVLRFEGGRYRPARE